MLLTFGGNVSLMCCRSLNLARKVVRRRPFVGCNTTSHQSLLYICRCPYCIGAQTFMISPCTQPVAATADYPVTHRSLSTDSGVATDSVAADRCGSTAGAGPKMAPADTQQGQHTLQHVISSVLPPSHTQQEQQSQPDKQLQQAPLQLPVDQPQPTDSADDSWTPGQPQSSEDNADVADYGEETWDPTGAPPQYCTNCTARLYTNECSDCGHSSEHDGTLFDSSSGTSSAADVAAHSHHQHSKPLIIWDDDMLLHEEGKAVPHPERPDRLRAIMARLVGNQLTGDCCNSSALL